VNNVAKDMEHLNKLAENNQTLRFAGLWEKILSEIWLAQAWEEIRKNTGSQTPGIDKETAQDIDLNRIRQLSKKLHEERYRPKSVRRVYIPKSNGKLRPLGIPTIEDRIVQQAVRMVLEPIFETDFLPCSHGFRQGHSTHTALRDVARMSPRVSWIIEGDIVGCFDSAC
jgi:retron-type reverse transcriptase